MGDGRVGLSAMLCYRKEQVTMCQRIRKEGLTKAEFRKLGGLSNPDLFRTQSKGGAWRYWRTLDNGRDG
jgi:hypothetical protein